jgi:hypothetical protein
VKKQETLQEYLNRGGIITILPPQESPTPTYSIPVANDVDLGSLGLGNALVIMTPETKFSGRKVTKQKPNLASLVKDSWLPDDIKAYIFSKIEEAKNESE